MKYYKIPKKYNFKSVNLSANNRLVFVSEQLTNIEKLNTKLLKGYQEKFKKLISENRSPAAMHTISSDIVEFLHKISFAREELYKLNRIYSKGASGEDTVHEYLVNYRERWIPLQNVNLNIEGNRIENDFILIDPSGIYTLEVKNIGNYREKLIFDEYGRTIREDKHGNVISQSDILAQSNRHLALLQRFIASKISYELPLEQLVIIASDVKVVNKSLLTVIGTNNIYPYITNKASVISKENMNELQKIFLASMVDEKNYPVMDYYSILKENYTLILMSIKELLEDMA